MARGASGRGERGRVQSLDRALDILEALAAAGESVGVVELSERVSLHSSTVHRLLATLVSRGYARQDRQAGRYALGLRALQLGRVVSERFDLRTEAQPYLRQLVEQSGETANLIVMDRGEAVYVAQAPSPRLVRMFAEIGRRVPLHSTAGGKAILAFLSPAEREAVLQQKGLVARTPHTITSAEELERVLTEVRRSGYAVDDEEQEEGVRCVAAPVRGHRGGILGAISLSGPTSRLTKERLRELGELVRATSLELSLKLGFEP